SSSPPSSQHVYLPRTVVVRTPPIAQVGQEITFSVSVSGPHGVPTGGVIIGYGPGSSICTTILSAGSGSCQSTLRSGLQTVEGNYSGDATYADSAASNSYGPTTLTV